ncbi:peptidylprolyl isomerase [Pseudoruegeria sp. SK021]|uniref:peptidylprolyl isomerase n=1 Tax=Pseudoruegeria sp. SK021 TaxID=1933035 RepID=UPI000A22B161|nr:peptidylprolyl isomerase [Pseudoruegeria sp. SK021]OSP55421.1 hypothetical protein BV911_07155 [Pseudoruegeria sp. SK021]
MANLPKQLLRTLLAASGLLLGASLATPAVAQSPFEVVARVNDGAITRFELDQRRRLQNLLRLPGADADTAMNSLVDDRLKISAAKKAGIDPTNEEVQLGLEDFASRANLSSEEFIQAVRPMGIEPETLTDYVFVSLAWGDLMRSKYSSRAQVSDSEIERALALGTGQGTAKVLLSEIILPIAPEVAAISEERANAIVQMTSFSQFEDAARQFSIAPSRANGGRLEWTSLSDLPPQIAPLFLTMTPGQVTAPLRLDSAVALFQFRGLQDVAAPRAQNVTLDYAQLRFAPGTDLQQERVRLMTEADTCDDLYGLFKSAPPEQLQRVAELRNSLPQSVVGVLDQLDPSEFGVLAPQGSSDTGSIIMLCARSAPANEDLSREDVARRLTAQRLNSYAEGFLSELRSDAFIEMTK